MQSFTFSRSYFFFFIFLFQQNTDAHNLQFLKQNKRNNNHGKVFFIEKKLHFSLLNRNSIMVSSSDFY